MIDNPGAGPVPGDDKDIPKPEINAEDDSAHKKRDEELFGDLDDEATVETPESIKADRDRLLQEMANMVTRLRQEQALNQALTRNLEEAAQVQIRMKKLSEEHKAFALEKFVTEFLPLIDNLERGLKAITKTQRDADPKLDRIAQGFEKIVGQQLSTVFNKFGIREINPPRGDAFDVNKHEALKMDDCPDVESEAVVEVVQKGYELNGRIIRTAKVSVKP